VVQHSRRYDKNAKSPEEVWKLPGEVPEDKFQATKGIILGYLTDALEIAEIEGKCKTEIEGYARKRETRNVTRAIAWIG
jgi:hypothetical protein